VSKLRRIKSVETRPGYKLVVAWDDGTSSVVDLSTDINMAGLFAVLRESEAFERVAIDPQRRAVQWLYPDGSTRFDSDADALFELGEQQKTHGVGKHLLMSSPSHFPRLRGQPLD
jgi:hypothetical protein